MPILRKMKEDGSEEEIDEEELFKYMRYRWLYNESESLAMRYRRFNVPALLDAAVNVVEGAKYCVELLKCIEGQSNKAFLLTMDNGAQVLAKIPNPNAGPDFLTTASEVATLQFLRNVLNVPVPRVYAYSTDPLNSIGAEYILEEKAYGEPLGQIWSRLDTEVKSGLVEQLVDFETRLASVSFSRHGCIYFKKDLVQEGLRFDSLECRFMPSAGFAETCSTTGMDEFAVGPLTEEALWDEGRATMDLDRGPWRSPQAYITAMGTNEKQWAKLHAQPRINPYRSVEECETPEEYVSLLDRFLRLIAPLSPDACNTSLSHPDCHLDNVFMDPDTKQISCIIDWQSASISYPYFQSEVPRMLLPIACSLPSELKSDTTSNLLLQYKNQSRLKNQQHWKAKGIGRDSLLIEAAAQITGAWTRNDTFSLRHTMIAIAAGWKTIASTTEPCPIHFSKQELKNHQIEWDNLKGFKEVLHALAKEDYIPVGGMVLREKYEHAVHVNKTVKQWFLDMAEDESEREYFSKIWPYQDREP